jgi:hypothetical protein
MPNEQQQSASVEPMSPDAALAVVLIAVTIVYPGTSVSDILIGGVKVQISNEALRDAGRLALDPAQSYDINVNTEDLFGDLEDDDNLEGDDA